MKTKKITINLWDQLASSLSNKFNESCLRRDAYLDFVLKHEADKLMKELDQAASERQRKYIERNLSELKRTQVSLNLSSDTVASIEEACHSRNLVRDSFINRVLLFLVLKPDLFGRLLGIDIRDYINSLLDDGEFIGDTADMVLKGGLNCINALVHKDPFWAVRECIRIASDDSDDGCEQLHAAYIPPDFLDKDINLAGLNCVVEEWRIEERPGQEIARTKLDELLGTFDAQPSLRIVQRRKTAKGK